MKKSDIKWPMWGRLDNGNMWWAKKGEFGLRSGVWINWDSNDGPTPVSLSEFNEDLVAIDGSCKITEVYGMSTNRFGYKYWDLDIRIWVREEKVELTLDEIAAKFNISVSQLKIKK